MNNQRIFRVEKNKNYSIVDNRVMRDMRLSWQAKGLMAYILTLPDDWRIYPSEIKDHAHTGINGTRSALRELKKYGYLSWKRAVSQNGKFLGYEYYIHEEPILPRDEIHYTLKKLKNEALPCDDKPYTDKPYAENRTLLSTNPNELLTTRKGVSGENNKDHTIHTLLSKKGFNDKQIECIINFITIWEKRFFQPPPHFAIEKIYSVIGNTIPYNDSIDGFITQARKAKEKNNIKSHLIYTVLDMISDEYDKYKSAKVN